jgi:hypothetical protein
MRGVKRVFFPRHFLSYRLEIRGKKIEGLHGKGEGVSEFNTTRIYNQLRNPKASSIEIQRSHSGVNGYSSLSVYEIL